MMCNAAAAAKAVQMLDLLTEYFDGGENWLQYSFHNDLGGRCLVSAMSYLRYRHRLYGDDTRYYLLRAAQR